MADTRIGKLIKIFSESMEESFKDHFIERDVRIVSVDQVSFWFYNAQIDAYQKVIEAVLKEEVPLPTPSKQHALE